MGPSISVFGLGYVGSVSAACFASMGHRVIGVDVNPDKLAMMEGGRSPIIEAKMNGLVAEANRACRLHATVDSIAAVRDSDVSFVCVGTPSLRSGKLDSSHIEKVAREIGAALKQKNQHTLSFYAAPSCPGQLSRSSCRFWSRQAGGAPELILLLLTIPNSCARQCRS